MKHNNKEFREAVLKSLIKKILTQKISEVIHLTNYSYHILSWCKLNEFVFQMRDDVCGK